MNEEEKLLQRRCEIHRTDKNLNQLMKLIYSLSHLEETSDDVISHYNEALMIVADLETEAKKSLLILRQIENEHKHYKELNEAYQKLILETKNLIDSCKGNLKSACKYENNVDPYLKQLKQYLSIKDYLIEMDDLKEMVIEFYNIREKLSKTRKEIINNLMTGEEISLLSDLSDSDEKNKV